MNLPEPDNGANDVDGHLNGPRAVKYACSHDGPMLGENERELPAPELVIGLNPWC